ncbi:MAG: hypothetical protein K0B06_11780, partial [Brevefilum sp.]|nr:hypothetical protein [Brevefilum sp.]
VDFKAWTTQHELLWAGVGLDIEMDLNDLRIALSGEADPAFARRLWRKFRDKPRVAQIQRSYQALVDLIRADGYPVESYHLPLITDERRARSTVLQRALGLVDLQADREVLTLYTSLLSDHGDAFLWSYAPKADAVGVGITGGGVNLSDSLDLPPLTWDQFARDLRLCVMQNKPVHIFSLEGCVEQGFLSRLNTFDWDQPAPVPANLAQVHGMRTGLAALLWMIERPWAVLLGLATVFGLGFLFKRTEDKRKWYKT